MRNNSSQNFPNCSQSPAYPNHPLKRVPLWLINEESPNRTSGGIVWDDRATPMRNNEVFNNERVVGKRQKSSSELSKEETFDNTRRQRRHHSSPILIVDPEERAKVEKLKFDEFAKLLKVNQSDNGEKLILPKPRKIFESLNESLNDSVIDADKSILNVDIGLNKTNTIDEDEEDSFMADEEMLASMEAEAIKTLLSQVKTTPIVVNEKPKEELKPSTNDEMDDDDDIFMAIPLELLSGDNIPSEPICFDYRELTQRNKTQIEPLTAKSSAFQPKSNVFQPKSSAFQPKPIVTSNLNRPPGNQPQPPYKPTESTIVAPPAATVAQVKCTPAEIQAKREEAKRRLEAKRKAEEAAKRRQLNYEKWQKSQQNKAKPGGGGGGSV